MTDRKKDMKEKGKIVLFGILFVFAWLGIMFTLFPVSNPLHAVEGAFGVGVFYAALFSLGIMIIVLLFMAIRQSLKDILKSIGDEFGVDVEEVGYEYKRLLKDEILIMLGKKKRISDHHDEEE